MAIFIMNRKKMNVMSMMNNMLWDLPAPSTMSYFWNFGSILGMSLVIQITTGIFLTFHYSASSEFSFDSVIMIMRETWSGWLIRFMHMNGASMFFMMIYMHMARGLYYNSSQNIKTWVSGVMILIMLMMISFLGYVLPWGQMSYWAVAVITNLFSVIPMVGMDLVKWMWGGFSVGSPTLIRFYSLHFLTPFILSMMVIMHLSFLHKSGSSNTMGITSNLDKIQFHPYFSVKDLVLMLLFLWISFMISMNFPYQLGDTVNNIPANPMQTPSHIQPEWYFLTYYAILRALPTKTTGVIALLSSVIIFMILPIYKNKFSTKFSPYRTMMFCILISNFLVLMKLGSMPAEQPFIEMSKIMSLTYFMLIMSINM